MCWSVKISLAAAVYGYAVVYLQAQVLCPRPMVRGLSGHLHHNPALRRRAVDAAGRRPPPERPDRMQFDKHVCVALYYPSCRLLPADSALPVPEPGRERVHSQSVPHAICYWQSCAHSCLRLPTLYHGDPSTDHINFNTPLGWGGPPAVDRLCWHRTMERRRRRLHPPRALRLQILLVGEPC